MIAQNLEILYYVKMVGRYTRKALESSYRSYLEQHAEYYFPEIIQPEDFIQKLTESADLVQ